MARTRWRTSLRALGRQIKVARTEPGPSQDDRAARHRPAARQDLTTRWPPPTVSAIIQESVLRRPFGGPDVRRTQRRRSPGPPPCGRGRLGRGPLPAPTPAFPTHKPPAQRTLPRGFSPPGGSCGAGRRSPS
ncbi:Scr1 family TA system antitoxin-like transcriptional regulator [Streptomyces sp. HPF1205]|uniref:Scr1 family TA system antitoxin-like transcriptional regulator n=1 Tax=Streptomyces sp. HPF1205 TaxID=2873262 RepID=UPI001CEC1690|nr:Scr1 family TA system antitoxin-like transcriptional regulator [Streptomyces sp. HPF1205]